VLKGQRDVTSGDYNSVDAEVLLGHCSLRIYFSDRSFEQVVTDICGHRCAACRSSPGQPGRWEMTLYGPLTDLLPMLIRLQDALPAQVETALRIGVRLGTRPLLAHLTVEPEPD
jgi:hypothetical protein